MSERQLDDLLTELERSIAKLAGGTAPLEELVAAHQQAVSLLTAAEARMADLKARADDTAKLLSE